MVHREVLLQVAQTSICKLEQSGFDTTSNSYHVYWEDTQ